MAAKRNSAHAYTETKANAPPPAGRGEKLVTFMVHAGSSVEGPDAMSTADTTSDCGNAVVLCVVNVTVPLAMGMVNTLG
jgi:hypothetical protein